LGANGVDEMVIDISEGCLSGMVLTVGRLVRIHKIIFSEMIRETRFYNTFYNFGYE
jgi:hypothetical protein